MRRAAAPVALGLLLCGCPAQRADDADATVEKLKALQAAQPRGGAPSAPNEALAQRAANTAPSAARPLALPAVNGKIYANRVALRLLELSVTDRVGKGRVELVTSEAFLVIRLSADSEARGPERVDLATAVLETPSGEFQPARDAQRAVGTPLREYAFEPMMEKGGVEWTLVFELPQASIGQGMALKLSGARIPLQ